MSREKEGFHDNVAALNEMFPDKGMLTKSDVARFMGASLDKAVQDYNLMMGNLEDPNEEVIDDE